MLCSKLRCQKGSTSIVLLYKITPPQAFPSAAVLSGLGLAAAITVLVLIRRR